MNERESAAERPGRLAAAIRDVKVAAVERDDVVVEMREATRMRLELLAQELAPVFAEVPEEEILFDFAISSGAQPRLWIDAVSHVAMGRDRRTYRFVRDTRMGRTVLAESTDLKPIANQVTLYIAERMVERQRWLDGTAEPVAASARHRDAQADAPLPAPGEPARSAAVAPRGGERNGGSLLSYARTAEQPDASAAQTETPAVEKPAPNRLRSFLSGLAILLFGAVAGLAILVAVYYDEVAAYLAAN